MADNTLTFSISTPVFRQAEFIRSAMESLRCQTMPLQLAVLDATPDDSVQRVLKDYQNLITYQYHHADDGQTAAIQEGWDNTKGDIVAWLNADDYYYPDTLAKVANIFLKHPEIDVVYGQSICVSADGAFLYYAAVKSDPDLLPRSCIIAQPSCFVRRTALERIGGLNKSLHFIMDWDFWLRLYKSGSKFYFLDELLSVVRLYPATKTLSGSKERYQEIANILSSNTTKAYQFMSLLSAQYYDLSHNPQKNTLEKIKYYGLKILQQLYKWYFKPEVLIHYGLQYGSNLISNRCAVILPWYEAIAPKQLKFITSKPVNIEAIVNGNKINLTQAETVETTFLGNIVKGHCYTGTLPEIKALLFTIELQSEGEWQLYSLSLT